MNKELFLYGILPLLAIFLHLQTNTNLYVQAEDITNATKLPISTSTLTPTELENITTSTTLNNSSVDETITSYNSTENVTESDNVTTVVDVNATEEEITALPTLLPSTPNVTSGLTDVPFQLRNVGVPCMCDLTSTECDVNCCCDSQCSSGDRRAFSGCALPPAPLNTDYCYQENFLFANNTPYKMIKTSSNLFCIYKDNYQGRFLYKDITTVTDPKSFDKLDKKYQQFPWPAQNPFLPNIDDAPKFGTPVYTRFDSGLLGYLDIPTSSINGECIAANPAAYMQNEENACNLLITDLKLECKTNVWLDARTYFQGFTVARSPVVFKDSINATLDDFLEVTPQLCLDFYGVHGRCNATDPTDIPLPSYNATSLSCDNAVSRALYTITHNGTEGIIAVQVRLTLDTITKPTQSTTYKWRWTQNHGVAFAWTKPNSSSENSFRYSGNPGYIVGMPVLAGKLVSEDVGGDEPDFRQAVRLSSDSSDWLTVVGAIPGGGGRCFSPNEVGTTTGRSRLPVRFGEDLQTGCSLEINLRNLTDDCAVVQMAALDALLGTSPPDAVGAYGNSRVEHPGDWVPILRDHQLPPPSRTIDQSCTNIVRDLSVRVLFANFGSLANPQAKIVGVQVSLEAPGELRLRCVGRFCGEGADELAQTVVVTSSVCFVDVSETAVPVYAERPTIRIELPGDFFYPFSSSAAPRIICVFNMVLVCLAHFMISRWVMHA